MIVHDVVQIVSPDTRSSYTPGRWMCETHDDEATARERAAVFNQCCRSESIRYKVESHDEESLCRAWWEHDYCRHGYEGCLERGYGAEGFGVRVDVETGKKGVR